MSTPDFWLSLTRLLILLLTICLAWLTYRTNLLLKEFQPTFNVLLSLPESVARLLIVGLCLFLAWLSGLPLDHLGLAVETPWLSVGQGVLIGLIIQFPLNFGSHWAIEKFGSHIYSPWLLQNIIPRRPIEWLLVPLAFIPAVTMEELIFRTLWLGGFQGIVSLPILIFGTSIIFGFMHQPQGILGVIAAGGLNIFLSLLFIWSGELITPLTAHYIINVLQVITAHYQFEQ